MSNEGTEPELYEPSGMGYSNEWVNFLDKLVKDGTVADLHNYIDHAKMSNRAKRKLKLFVLAFLDMEFAVTNLKGARDYDRIMSEKALVESELYDGLLRCDITHEFQSITNIVRARFTARLFRSRAGWQGANLNSQRQEIINTEQAERGADRDTNDGLSGRVRMIFSGR